MSMVTVVQPLKKTGPRILLMQPIELSVMIQAQPSSVWKALTNPDLMKHWMGEAEMKLEIITDWQVGNPIVIRGFHHTRFENKGTVLQFEPEKTLKYDYLSSISHLADKPENRTIIGFRLTPISNQTSLGLTLNSFPTESIFRHVQFYWITTITILKQQVEREHLINNPTGG